MGKRKTVWFSTTEGQDEAAYLRKMAADGWILEDMTHLAYVFREDEPQNYFYQLERREAYLSEEEREKLAAEGWQEVCHYELYYIYCKDGTGIDEAVIEPQIVQKELDRKIREEEERRKQSMTMGVVTLVIAVVIALLIGGFSKILIFPLLLLCMCVLPRMALDHAASNRRIRKLEEKKEDLADGTYEKEDEYRPNRRLWQVIGVVVLLILIGCDLYYRGNFNEKGFTLPEEISYAEVPAVRLERLIDEPLIRTGTAFDPSLEGLRFETDRAKTLSYDIDKEWGQIKNCGTDYRYIPGMKKKLRTKQQMQNAEGAEWELDTMYTHYRSKKIAESDFSAEVKHEIELEKHFQKEGIHFPEIEACAAENDFFDELHICRRDFTETTKYHFVCRKGTQLMTVDYHGDDRTEAILTEVEKVFRTQK